MAALRVALIVIDGVTLDDITPIRDRLEALGAQVVVVIPGGGTLLPTSGRYYPGAGGHGTRRALCQVSTDDFDLLLLPDGVSGDQLARYPQALTLIRGLHADSPATPLPVFTFRHLLTMLEHGHTLDRLARAHEEALSGCSHP